MSAVIEHEGTPVAEVESPLLSMIERAAMNPDINVEKLERLMAMQERILDRDAKVAYADAMHAAQGEIKTVLTNKKNSQTSSRYADLAQLDGVIRPIYTKHGFALTYGTEASADPLMVAVVCDVLHRNGHEKRHRIDMPADGKGAKGNDVMTRTHATGAAMTYGRRYLAAAIFNVPTADDDGQSAGRTKYLSEEEALEIHATIHDNALDLPGFLKFMDVDAIADIKADKLGQVRNLLKKKIAAKAKG
jgi:hypothetical protein